MAEHDYIIGTEANFAQEVEAFPGTALVDFWAAWCAPCQIMGPIIEDLAAKYKGEDGVKVVKVDVDSNPNLAEKLQVYSIPTIKFFRNGQMVDETVGVTLAPDLTKRLEAARA